MPDFNLFSTTAEIEMQLIKVLARNDILWKIICMHIYIMARKYHSLLQLNG